MERIKLWQILQYLTMADRTELIQIVTNDNDWDDAHELSADCELLEPFYDYLVTDMSFELSYMSGEPVIRVGIEKNNIRLIA